MIRVLFVCLGNICRSPMAEAVFLHLVREAGLESAIEADSAGTGDWHINSAPHPGTMQMLQIHGIEYEGQGRQLRAEDLDDFDYIITMDDQNERDTKRLIPRRTKPIARIAPLLSFAPQVQQEHGIREVPDPYFDGGFEVVYGLVLAGARGLLATIRREHNL